VRVVKEKKSFAMSAILISLLLLVSTSAQRNSRDLLQGSLPYLETYWESYLQYTTRPDSCLDLSSYEPPTDSDFGIRITDVPDEVNVVNIAFGDARWNDCHRYDGIYAVCEPYICGLHLYGVAGIGLDQYEQLVSDIATLQGQGKIVKLAYGGEEYGNLFGGEYARNLDIIIDSMVNAVDALGLDGVDIVNEEGGGADYWLGADAQTGQQLYFLRRYCHAI